MIDPETINVELSVPEAMLFREFMRRRDFIGYLTGYMDSLGLLELKNASIELDIDDAGIVRHMAITKHYKK